MTKKNPKERKCAIIMKLSLNMAPAMKSSLKKSNKRKMKTYKCCRLAVIVVMVMPQGRSVGWSRMIQKFLKELRMEMETMRLNCNKSMPKRRYFQLFL